MTRDETPAANLVQRRPRDIAMFGDDVYVAVDGNSILGSVARYDAATGARKDSLDMLACALASGTAWYGRRAVRSWQRLSTDAEKLHKLRQIFLPYQPPGVVSTVRVQLRELALGAGSLWVLGDALDRRVWRLDPRERRDQATIVLPFRRARWSPRPARPGSLMGCTTRSCRSTRASNRPCSPAVPVGRGAAGVHRGRRRRLGGERD